MRPPDAGRDVLATARDAAGDDPPGWERAEGAFHFSASRPNDSGLGFLSRSPSAHSIKANR